MVMILSGPSPLGGANIENLFSFRLYSIIDWNNYHFIFVLIPIFDT